MSKKTLTIQNLKPDPDNPRKISDDALIGLRYSEKEFGDISSIVWNKRTGHLVAGHQRLRALKEEYGEGLVMEGNAIRTPDGHEFNVRVVDWPMEKQRSANIAANNPHISGVFTAELEKQLDDLIMADPQQFDSLRLDDLRAELDAIGDDGPIALLDPRFDDEKRAIFKCIVDEGIRGEFVAILRDFKQKHAEFVYMDETNLSQNKGAFDEKD